MVGDKLINCSFHH